MRALALLLVACAKPLAAEPDAKSADFILDTAKPSCADSPGGCYAVVTARQSGQSAETVRGRSDARAKFWAHRHGEWVFETVEGGESLALFGREPRRLGRDLPGLDPIGVAFDSRPEGWLAKCIGGEPLTAVRLDSGLELHCSRDGG